MSNRITCKTLAASVDTINTHLGLDVNHRDGAYQLYAAYGAYALNRTCGNGSTGTRRIYGLTTARDLNTFVNGLLAGLETA